MNKSNFVLTLLLIALIGALGYIVYDKVLYAPSNTQIIVVNTTTTEPVACTMDAKLCPDGSYVGRTGPTCEFAACPDNTMTPPPVEGMETWKTTSTLQASFRYPMDFGTTYIHPQDWPPVLTMATTSYSCIEAGSQIAQAGQSKKVIMDGREYCRTISSEGAAGSIYNQYTYMTVHQGKNVILTFTTRAVQCANYNDNERADCEAERENFNVDSVASQILWTVVFKK